MTGSLAQRGHSGQPLGPVPPMIATPGSHCGIMQAMRGQMGVLGTQSQHGATKHCLVVESTEIWPSGHDELRSAHVLGACFWHVGQPGQLFSSRGVTKMLPGSHGRGMAHGRGMHVGLGCGHDRHGRHEGHEGNVHDFPVRRSVRIVAA